MDQGALKTSIYLWVVSEEVSDLSKEEFLLSETLGQRLVFKETAGDYVSGGRWCQNIIGLSLLCILHFDLIRINNSVMSLNNQLEGMSSQPCN
jgi:hypothetical protein